MIENLVSTYVSQRGEAKAEFIKSAQNLLIYSITTSHKFPQSWRYPVVDKVLQLANEVFEYSQKANVIMVRKDMTLRNYELRERYIQMARSSVAALEGQLNVLYLMVRQGNNFFDGKKEYNKVFNKWGAYVNACGGKLKGIAESDQKRWAEYQEARAKAAAEQNSDQSEAESET